MVSGLASNCFNNTSPNKLPNHFHLTLLAIYRLLIYSCMASNAKNLLTKIYRFTAVICGSVPTTLVFWIVLKRMSLRFCFIARLCSLLTNMHDDVLIQYAGVLIVTHKMYCFVAWIDLIALGSLDGSYRLRCSYHACRQVENAVKRRNWRRTYVRRKADFWCLYSTLSIHVQLCTCWSHVANWWLSHNDVIAVSWNFRLQQVSPSWCHSIFHLLLV